MEDKQVTSKAEDVTGAGALTGTQARSSGVVPSVLTGHRQRLRALLSLSHRRSRNDYRDLARLSAELAAHDVETDRKWEDHDRAELDALLAEYESVRQESMSTINNRTQIMILGLAAVAALVAGSLTLDDLSTNRTLVIAIFSGAIPLACVIVFLLWLSEATRSHRAGYFLASSVEARINAKLGRLAVTWEAALWTGFIPRDELFGPSMIALMVLGIFAVCAPPFGLFLVDTPIALHGRPLYELWLPYLLLAVIGAYTLRHMKQLRNVPLLVSAMHS
jgi:hypothetical protein